MAVGPSRWAAAGESPARITLGDSRWAVPGDPECDVSVWDEGRRMSWRDPRGPGAAKWWAGGGKRERFRDAGSNPRPRA